MKGCKQLWKAKETKIQALKQEKELAKINHTTQMNINRKIQKGIKDLRKKLKVGDDNGEKEKKHSKNNKSSVRR